MTISEPSKEYLLCHRNRQTMKTFRDLLINQVFMAYYRKYYPGETVPGIFESNQCEDDGFTWEL